MLLCLLLQKTEASEGTVQEEVPTAAAAADAPSRGTRAASRSRASSAAAEVYLQLCMLDWLGQYTVLAVPLAPARGGHADRDTCSPCKTGRTEDFE